MKAGIRLPLLAALGMVLLAMPAQAQFLRRPNGNAVAQHYFGYLSMTSEGDKLVGKLNDRGNCYHYVWIDLNAHQLHFPITGDSCRERAEPEELIDLTPVASNERPRRSPRWSIGRQRSSTGIPCESKPTRWRGPSARHRSAPPGTPISDASAERRRNKSSPGWTTTERRYESPSCGARKSAYLTVSRPVPPSRCGPWNRARRPSATNSTSLSC